MTALHLNNLKTQMLVRHEELVLLGCELKWRTCASKFDTSKEPSLQLFLDWCLLVW